MICSCGCGDTVTTCKCSSSCSCRKAGGSCYKVEKKSAVEYAGNDPAELKWHDDMQQAVAAWEKKWNTKWEDYPPKAKKKKLPVKTADSSPAWQRSAGKNEEGGLNAKGRASYKAQTGGTLKAPVTESNPTGERDKRQNSFCSRMCGMKRVNTGADTAKDPDSRINKSLSKWNCKCSAAMAFGQDIKAALLLS